MAFDLANAVLLLVGDLHVAIPHPENETLERERDPSRTNEVKVSQ